MLSHGGLPEVPCARCGRRVRGLAWGDLCAECAGERQRRAKRLAGRAAIGAALAAAVYVTLQLPSTPAARYYGALAVLVTYVLARKIVQRIAMEVMK